MRARIAHCVLIAVGLLLFLYPLTVGATPNVSCRGVEMHPGDSCAKADNSGFQTYEERARTASEAKPIILGVGLLVVGFGTFLLLSDLRLRRQRGPGLPAIPESGVSRPSGTG
jgi:hypothetical protein